MSFFSRWPCTLGSSFMWDFQKGAKGRRFIKFRPKGASFGKSRHKTPQHYEWLISDWKVVNLEPPVLAKLIENFQLLQNWLQISSSCCRNSNCINYGPERCCLDQGDGQESKKEDSVSNGHPVNVASIVKYIYYMHIICIYHMHIL